MSNDRSPAELDTDFAAVARLAEVDGELTTLLHIGDEHLVLLSGRGPTPETVQRFDLGAARIAREHFRHDPPDMRDIERAIDFIEDEIMRHGKTAVASTRLWSVDSALRAWSDLSGPIMTLETVEQWFQRLASVALGQPSAMRGLPAGREAAATLLVLREFMHHRGHGSVWVVDPTKSVVGPSASA